MLRRSSLRGAADSRDLRLTVVLRIILELILVIQSMASETKIKGYALIYVRTSMLVEISQLGLPCPQQVDTAHNSNSSRS